MQREMVPARKKSPHGGASSTVAAGSEAFILALA